MMVGADHSVVHEEGARSVRNGSKSQWTSVAVLSCTTDIKHFIFEFLCFAA